MQPHYKIVEVKAKPPDHRHGDRDGTGRLLSKINDTDLQSVLNTVLFLIINTKKNNNFEWRSIGTVQK